MKIVTASEMREIDRITTEKYGVPSLTLMENAGSAVAEFVLQEYPAAKRIGVICGKGNNGGDGFVAARKLHQAGRKVEVLLLADPAELKGDAAAMYKKLPVKAVVARSVEELKSEAARHVYKADLLVDAILGTGFQPPVKGYYRAAIEMTWKAQTRAISVDLPSGVDADSISASERQEGSEEELIPAVSDGVVTFTTPKPAHALLALTRGPVVVVAIGAPAEAISSGSNLDVTTARDIAWAFVPRRPDAHKGDFGHVLVIGGSVGKAGAAAMAGMAALRAGAGLVTVAVPRSILPTVAGFAPELMTAPLEETAAGSISMSALESGGLEALLKGKSVVALGPGISRNSETSEFVRTVVRSCSNAPLILDADGLNAFAEHAEKLGGGDRWPLVLTPHPGEMGQLAGLPADVIQQDRIGIARRFAQEHQVTVVLKGHRTLIATPEGAVWVNPTGNPGMATAGTGDILTGMIAGMTAQWSSPGATPGKEAFLAAVYLHGMAGDIARERMGEHCLVATDLLAALPEAYARARERVVEKFVHISG
jgi:NAD(P)H-hydrate epimerase